MFKGNDGFASWLQGSGWSFDLFCSNASAYLTPVASTASHIRSQAAWNTYCSCELRVQSQSASRVRPTYFDSRFAHLCSSSLISFLIAVASTESVNLRLSCLVGSFKAFRIIWTLWFKIAYRFVKVKTSFVSWLICASHAVDKWFDDFTHLLYVLTIFTDMEAVLTVL
jgi:hypothetical protein